MSAIVSVQGDFSLVNNDLEALRSRIMNINAQVVDTNLNVNKAFSDGTRLLNVMFIGLKNNAIGMEIQAAQQVIQTGVTLATTLSAIAVAKQTGNIFGVISLSASATSLTANLISARVASQEAIRRTRSLERLNRTRAALR